MVLPDIPRGIASFGNLGIESMLATQVIESHGLLQGGGNLDELFIEVIVESLLIALTAMVHAVLTEPLIWGVLLVVAAFVSFIFIGFIYTKAFAAIRQLFLRLLKEARQVMSDILYYSKPVQTYISKRVQSTNSTAANDSEESPSKNDAETPATTQWRDAVTVIPSDTPIDVKAFSETLNEMGTRLDYYITLTDGPIEIDPTPPLQSDFVYIITADGGGRISDLQSDIKQAYPQDYHVKTASISFPTQQRVTKASRMYDERLYSLEYTAQGDSASADTLTPFAPAVNDKSQYDFLSSRVTRPLVRLFTRLKDKDCVGFYHVPILPNDIDGDAIGDVATEYEDGENALWYQRHFDWFDDDKLADSQTARKLRDIESNHFVTVDPRFVVWGKTRNPSRKITDPHLTISVLRSVRSRATETVALVHSPAIDGPSETSRTVGGRNNLHGFVVRSRDGEASKL